MKQLLHPPQLTSFYYNNQLYIRVVPSKALFKSTMVHDVVNRGDVFAMRVCDQVLTIVPGKAEVIHQKIEVREPIILNSEVQQELFL